MVQELGLSWESGSFSTFQINARIANPPPMLLARYTRKEREFFFEYASFVLKIIENAQVLDRLKAIFEREKIGIKRPVDLRIMVFPARSLRGRPNRTLHGSYSQSSSQISLYPLKLPRELARAEGLDMFTTTIGDLPRKTRMLLLEISRSAVSTLIHEILHVKFESRGLPRYAEEAIVRKLERQYLQEWEDELPDIIEVVLARTSR